MSKLDELIQELCPDGVEYMPLWSVTIWDKKFNAVDRAKQPEVINYNYLLASELFALEVENGDVFLLSTGEQTGWTTEELAGKNLREGEVVTIPWGKSRSVTDCIKYYKGKFVTADNRIMTSNNTDKLNNKYLYYWIMTQGKLIDTFYRGSGIKHPDMAKVLDMQIPVPPLEVQREIVRILDSFTLLTAELTAELTARKKQYEYYEHNLLFDDKYKRMKLSDLCTVNQGLQIPISKRLQEPRENCYRYITVQFLKNNEDEQYYIENPDKNVICKEDDILVTRTGSTGVIVYGVEGCFHNNFFKVTPNELIHKKYMYFLLRSKYMYNKMLTAASGGTVPDLPHKKFYALEVPVPTIDEQKHIVEMLEKFNELSNDITTGLPAEIEARQKQYEYYRDKLLNFKKLEK